MLDTLKLIPALGWLIFSALCFAAGEYTSKLWGYKPSVTLTLAVLFAYSIGVLAWLPALLHKNDLARMGTLWYLLSTPSTILIGVLLFKEKLSPSQWLGMALACLALWLLKD